MSQSQAANHAVREAACTCIAELGTKVTISCLSLLFMWIYILYINMFAQYFLFSHVSMVCVFQVSSDVLRPHIPELVRVLLECFRDDSWLVRDGGWYYL